MCWQLDIEIIPRKEIKHFDDRFLKGLVAPLSIVGSFPLYHLNDGHCLCNFFASEGNQERLGEIIAAIARYGDTKKVKFIKFWSTLPDKAELKKLDLGEFSSMEKIEEGILYEVIDIERFRYS